MSLPFLHSLVIPIIYFLKSHLSINGLHSPSLYIFLVPQFLQITLTLIDTCMISAKAL